MTRVSTLVVQETYLALAGAADGTGLARVTPDDLARQIRVSPGRVKAAIAVLKRERRIRRVKVGPNQGLRRNMGYQVVREEGR